MIFFAEQVATTAFNHEEFNTKFTIANMDESFLRMCEPKSCNDIQSLCKFSMDILPEKSTINIEGSFAGGSRSHVYKTPDKNAAKRLKKDSIALRY